MNADTPGGSSAIRQQALYGLAKGLQADLANYGRLRDQLQMQFALALRHDTTGLTEIASVITQLCTEIEVRRSERIELFHRSSGRSEQAPHKAAIVALFAHLPGAYQVMIGSMWDALAGLVRECQALNSRNCQLLVDQYEIMTRVLCNESDTYVVD